MDWNRLEHLLEEASDLPPERQVTFLREASGEDTELLEQALSLLKHIQPGADYFSALAAEVDAPKDVAGCFKPSDRIGPYRLREPLGEGGMGRVWLAEQSEPVRRMVALKVIKLGTDTREVIARFETERQALAVMDHPGIARVFDGGITDGGRPYFVMEAIQGVPITEFCDTHRLGTAARIRLFIQVCEAVQHAHLKGVIHRDLKPSNVLVAMHESGPVPKVIDFGVAKAVSGSLTDHTRVTSVGEMVGTPAYMSPEQAEQSGLDVDSRTDVYALGVVLYELLTGALPFEAETLRKPALMVRLLLRDVQVPTPSARLGDLADTQRTVAAARGTDVKTLRKQLRGDLDWIVMKAMEKDRTRRYETVNGLARDLRRYLGHEPVVARPPTSSYKLRRFVRRNRIAVAGAAATLAALLAGTIGTSVGIVRAHEAQAAAEHEAETASEVSRFLSDLFAESFPGQALGADRTAREILDRGAERVRSELGDQPIVQARLMQTIGAVYGQLSVQDRAVDLLEESLAIRERELGPDHAEVASTLIALARNLELDGDPDRREHLYRRAWAIYEREEGRGRRHRGWGFRSRTPGVGTAMNMLAGHLNAVGRYDEAAELFQNVLARVESRPDQDVPVPELDGRSPRLVAAPIRRNLARIYLRMGRVDEADAEFRAALATLEAELPAGHPEVAIMLRDIGRVQILRDQLEAAHTTYQAAFESLLRVFGEWHIQTANTLMDLGRAAELLGRLDEAEAHQRRALAITDSVRGPGSSASGKAYGNLGSVALRRGDFEAAESHFRTALRVRQTALPPGHSEVGELMGRIAEALAGQGRMEEAAELAEQGLEIMEGHLGVGHVGVELQAQLTTRIRLAMGDTAAAEGRRLAAVERAEAAKGDSPELVNAIVWLGSFYREIGRVDEARAAFSRALEVRERVAGTGAPTQSGYAATVQELGWALAGVLADLGRWAEASAVLADAVADYDRAAHPTLEQTRDVVLLLRRQARALEELGRDEEAGEAAERAAELDRTLDGEHSLGMGP